MQGSHRPALLQGLGLPCDIRLIAPDASRELILEESLPVDAQNPLSEEIQDAVEQRVLADPQLPG